MCLLVSSWLAPCSQAGKKTLQLLSEIDPSAHAPLRGAPIRLQQCIVNLLSNGACLGHGALC